jgi:hypothetical protein
MQQASETVTTPAGILRENVTTHDVVVVVDVVSRAEVGGRVGYTVSIIRGSTLIEFTDHWHIPLWLALYNTHTWHHCCKIE